MEDIPLDQLKAFDNLVGNDQSKMPNRKEVLDLLDEANFTQDMKDKLKSLLVGDVPTIFGYGTGVFLAVLFVLIIFVILFFFGYKLYKSIKDKELKKEEKKKAKMSKKKK